MVEGYAGAGVGVQVAERRPDLVEPFAAVGEVVVEDRQSAVDDRAVAGPDGLDLVGLGQRAQTVERAEVGAQLAVGVGDDGRARGRARCRRSAPRAPTAARTTTSPRCARASRPRGPRGRRRRPRHPRRAPPTRAGTPGRARGRRSPPAPRTTGRPRSGRGGDGSAARRPRRRPRRHGVEVRRRPAARGRPRPTARTTGRGAPRCSCRPGSSATRSARARTARRIRTTHPPTSPAPRLDHRRQPRRHREGRVLTASPRPRA